MRDRAQSDDGDGLSRRRLLAGAAAVGATGLAGCASVVRVDGVERTVERSFPASDVTSLRVTDAVDDIALTGTADSSVRVRAKKRGVKRDSTDALTLDADLSDGVLSVSTDRSDSLGTWRAGIDLELHVPDGVAVEAAATTDGDIVAEGVGGPATFESDDGDITVRDLSGSATIRTRDGDIAASSVDGRVTATTRDGDVTVRAPGAVGTIGTDDGDIMADVPRIESSATVRTGDGDIVVRFGDDLDADVEATTGDGRVLATGLANVDTSTETAVIGQVGLGGTPLTVHSDDGDITLQ